MPQNKEDLTPLPSPFNSIGAPQFYTTVNHPLLPVPNVAYVVIKDTSKSGIEMEQKREREGVGLGRYLALKPGDFVFSRDINGSGLPKDDVLEVWFAG